MTSGRLRVDRCPIIVTHKLCIDNLESTKQRAVLMLSFKPHGLKTPDKTLQEHRDSVFAYYKWSKTRVGGGKLGNEVSNTLGMHLALSLSGACNYQMISLKTSFVAYSVAPVGVVLGAGTTTEDQRLTV